MKITVEHEIPDEEDCGDCILTYCDYWDGNLTCRVYGDVIIMSKPCPACMEARKKGKKI